MAVIYFDNRRNRVFRTSRAGPRCSLASGERVSFNPFNRPPNRGENTIARNTFSPKKNKKFQLRNKQTKYDPLSKKRREKDRESERMTSRRIEPLFDYKKEYFEKKWKERCHLLRNWRENEGRATGLLLLRSNRREKRNISFTSDTCTCYPIGQTLPSAPRANPHCIEMCVRVEDSRGVQEGSVGSRGTEGCCSGWTRQKESGLQKIPPRTGHHHHRHSSIHSPSTQCRFFP